MMRRRLTLLTAVLCIGLGGLVLVPSAGATTHPTYPLGKAKSCVAHYVKKTERHEVKGKEVRYVACVWRGTATSTTTTTLASSPAPAKPAMTATLVSGSTIGLSTLLVTTDTYCVYCSTQTVPTSGLQTVSLVNLATNQAIATWTTTAGRVESIEWNFTTSTSFTGTAFVVSPTETPWNGPASIVIPKSETIGNEIGVQATFGGSSNLAASSSTVDTVNLL